MSDPIGARPRRRALRRAAVALATLLVLWLGASFAAALTLTGRASGPRPEPLPADLGPAAEELRLATRDGEQLGAWYAPSRRPGAAGVVLLHGNGGSRRHRLDPARSFLAEGCAVLLVTLRAHGDSTGERNDFGWSSRLDVIAAVEELERRRPGSRVVVCGASLGAAAAAFAASELGERVHGWILESVYRDLATAARRRVERYLPPGLDWLAYQGLRVAGTLVLPGWSRLSPAEAVTAIPAGVPVLLLTGARYLLSLPADVADVLAHCGGRAELVVIEEAGHGRLWRRDPERYRSAVLGLVRALE